jgi:RNA polymerase sigma-70 factor (ECF subfamily)
MLGSLADAEDMAQEAYLRWHAAKDTVSVQNPRAYLTRIVVRLCLDRLKSAQSRRETYIGPWLPEPLVGTSPFTQISPTNALADDLSFALLLTLERLSPLERAAFLLHDVFDMDFQGIAEVLERSEEACRQLAARARQHVRSQRPRFRASKQECERLTAAFAGAAQSGDPAALTELLAEDALLISDGGGRVPAAMRPVTGRDNVVRLILGLAAKLGTLAGIRLHPTLVNGLPGYVFYDSSGAFQTLALETRDDGKIAAIYVVRNPDKLRHLPAFSPA